jgi:hypothetical protein
MNTPTIVVLLASLSVLLTGSWAWRLTGNYFLLINTTLASFGLLFAAHQLGLRSPAALLVSLMCTMLLAGRYFGTAWRERGQPRFNLPTQLVGVTAALSLAATMTTYWTLTGGLR